MTIKSRLRISSLLYVAVALGIGLVLLTGVRNLKQELERNRLSFAVVTGLVDLTTLSDDHLIHPGRRSLRQWQAKYDDVGRSIERLAHLAILESEITNGLIKEYEELKSVFSQLQSVEAKFQSGESQSRIVAELRDRLKGLLVLKLQVMVTDARQLYGASQAHIHAGLNRSIRIMLLFVAVTGVIILGNHLLTRRIVIGPLTKLAKDTQIIASGMLDHVVDIKSRDEMGNLAQAFNRMTQDLKKSYGALEAEIRERKLSEEALRESEAKHRSLIEQIPAITYVASLDEVSSTLYISPQVESMLGFSPTEWLSDPEIWANQIHPDDRDRVLTDIVASHETGKPFDAEYRIVSKSGNISWFSDKAAVLYDEEERAVCIQGVMFDLTQRKVLEEQLRQNAVRNRLLADISEAFVKESLDWQPVLELIARRTTELIGDVCIIRLRSDDGRWIEPATVYHPAPESRAFLHGLLTSLSKRSVEMLVGQVVRTAQPLLIPAVRREMIPEDYWPFLERFDIQSILAVPLRSDDKVIGTLTMWRHGSEAPYTSEDQTWLQLIADRSGTVIAHARLFETIQRLNVELEQRVGERTTQLVAANKELEAFCYSVSHDLRTPLRAIDGFSQIVARKYSDLLDAKGQDYLQRVVAECRRMGELIDDLLKLSRLTRAEMRKEKVNLSAMASEIVAELKDKDPDRRVTTIIAPGLDAECDGGLMRVALENLLANAWKFTSTKPDAGIEFGAEDDDGGPVYFVRDNGAGFDMAYADKLFGAFQRLHLTTEFPGSGIGLATVQRVVHRHGGRVWANSVVGEGATFYFTLGLGGRS
ncbi:MAG: PAS domain-containing protein [Pseudomonadota bacterium]